MADLLNVDGSWNRALVRQHFLPADVTEILKIKPSRHLEADSIAWQPDKQGRFSVRSAYNMALDLIMAQQGIGESSARTDGSRPAWKLLWKCGAPAKVRVFAWKAAREALATRANKKRRHMELDGICTICGQEEETAHHALVRCPHAQNLWDAMRRVWDLPPIESLRNTQPDWLLMLLQELNDTQRMLVLMVLWRVWHVHNELTHEKPMIPVEVSKRFLCSYAESLLRISQYPHADIIKGKLPNILEGAVLHSTSSEPRRPVTASWEPPPENHVKLNFDGSYVAADGSAGAGMVLRDHTGQVIYAACRWLLNCHGPIEAEVAAYGGLKLALHWSQKPLLVEMDCAETLSLANACSPDRSRNMYQVAGISDLLKERQAQIKKISRTQKNGIHWTSRRTSGILVSKCSYGD